MSSSSNYNFLDRVLHRLAFCHPIVQKIFSELENDLFKRELEAIESRQEVFVTGLPRAGTTLMLELLYATGEFKTYTYRDMPFILSPLLWNKLSRFFQKAGTKKERAHGDGMEISFDSPEAFEEVVWLTHMSDKIVHRKWLVPLSADDITEEFSGAIRDSVRKVLIRAEHMGPDLQEFRYLSKNNANLSRIDALRKVFPTASILVLFRHPLAQISSLAKQHEHFLQVHASDPFSRQYMRWIGHYEFGENFKPINYGGWLGSAEPSSGVDETFWMRYWNVAYSYALEHRTTNVHFVDFDRLLQDREVTLEKISKALALKHEGALIEAAKTLRSPTTRPVEVSSCPPDDWFRAQDIYSQLRSLAI